MRKILKILFLVVLIWGMILLVQCAWVGDTYRVAVNPSPEEAGRTEGQGRYSPGERVTLEAVAEEGYKFSGWRMEERVVSTDPEYSFKIEQDRDVTAIFKPRRYQLKVEATEGGQVDWTGEPRYGETVELRAFPEEGHVFIKWTKDGDRLSGQGEYQVQIDRDLSLKAHFLPLQEVRAEYLELSTVPPEGGEVMVEPHREKVHKVELIASAEFGYHFVGWEKGESLIEVSRRHLVELEEGKNLVARFEEGLKKVDGDNLLAPVSKETYLGRYEPQDLEEIPEELNARDYSQYLRREALENLKEMYEAAQEDGVLLQVASAYRSYDRQEAIFQRNVERRGEEEANRSSARPGQSEHQLGTTVDFGGTGVDFTAEFAHTSQGEWLKENANRFGFVMSYPEDTEDITGYIYEPWHYRYIGVDKAVEFQETEKVLMEFAEARSRE